MKHQDIISKLSLEEKCYLLSGKDFWSSRSVAHAGVPSMTMSDGPHGVRKQEGAGQDVCVLLGPGLNMNRSPSAGAT